MGGISKCGDAMMREMLFEAALVHPQPQVVVLPVRTKASS
jgi:hypothetical protein